MAAPAGEQAKLKVFISYSRADLAFADELVAGLDYDGRFEVSIDRYSIVECEEWKKRLGALIADADTIAFVLSPNSARSDICVWEVEEALTLSKRIIPVLAEPLRDQLAPEQLAQLNYVRFDEGRSFMAGLKGLVRALSADLAWLREHTRLFARALEWQAGGRAANRLLSGPDVAAARAWAARRPKDAPLPTELHLDFIKASDEAEAARASRERKQLRRIWWAQGAVGLVVLAALAAAIWQARETEKREAIVSASLAHRAIEDGDYEKAMRIALQRLPLSDGWPLSLGWEDREIRALEAKFAGAAQLSSLLLQLKGHGGHAAFSPDGTRIVASSFNGTAQVWDAHSGRQLTELKSDRGFFDGSAIFNPDGTRILIASRDLAAQVWDASSGAQLLEVKLQLPKGDRDRITSITFSPDGTRIIAGSRDDTARIWDSKTGAQLLELKGEPWVGILSAAFTWDGARIVTVSISRARVWDASSGAQLFEFELVQLPAYGPATIVHSATFSPDGTRIVAGLSDRTARAWDSKTGVQLLELKGHGGEVVSAAFSPDGTRIVTGSYDRTARVWDAASGALLIVLRGHGDQVSNAVFSPDGSRVATAGDGTVRVWSASGSGLQHTELGGRVYRSLLVGSAAFSPDGARIVTGSGGGTWVWDTKGGAQLVELKGHVRCFSPDGARIVTGSDDGTAWGGTRKAVRSSSNSRGTAGASAPPPSALTGRVLSPARIMAPYGFGMRQAVGN